MIEFQVLNTAPVSIKVYDLIGREVAVLVNEVKQRGFIGFSLMVKILLQEFIFIK
ncbi:MAG: hypothetical protein MZV64_26255 [Ignavibacteriales bacterium]|nr:hypothetical protein [Ignavibacteriales bacterium]